MSDERTYVVWHSCVLDGRAHAVTDEDFGRAFLAGSGTYRAVCGHVVAPGSMLAPPGSPCSRCRADVFARGIHAPAVTARHPAGCRGCLPSERHGRTTPAGAGRASPPYDAPALVGPPSAGGTP